MNSVAKSSCNSLVQWFSMVVNYSLVGKSEISGGDESKLNNYCKHKEMEINANFVLVLSYTMALKMVCVCTNIYTL